MHIEFEAKFLNIDANEIRAKLKALGAELVFAEKLFERFNYDFADFRLDADRSWVRLREGEPDGDWTLCYKQATGNAVDSVKEVQFGVSSREDAQSFLEAIGLRVKNHQQRKREQWKLGDVEFDIDTWPWIPTFLEIEALTGDAVEMYANKLGLDFSQASFGGTGRVYKKYGFPKISSVTELRFDLEPEGHEDSESVD